jgi:hypothetical protein
MSIKTIVSTIYRDTLTGFTFTFEPDEDSIKIKRKKGGWEVKYLTRDAFMDSPDQWGDYSLFLVNYHRDFEVKRNNAITEDDVREWYQGKEIPQQKNYWIFGLTCFSHSGVVLYLGSVTPLFDPGGWDTSHVGVVLVSKKEFADLKAAEIAAGELLSDWNKYLSGDVWGVVKETFNKDKIPEPDHESVWGIYGYQEALEELKTFFKGGE